MEYLDALNYLYFKRPYGKIKIGLYRIEELLRRLNDPEKNYKCFHITGSNGKGSTTTFLHYLAKNHGHKVGGYLSPHLSSILERFPINGKYISKDRFLNAFNLVKKQSEEMDKKGKEFSPSFFEFATALAFEIDKEENVEISTIEVGLGGRFDATNVIIPKVSVITTVSLEHTKILGNSLEKIAYEKAGIIKENRPVVIGNVPKKAKKVIYDIAADKNAKVYELGKDFDYEVVEYQFGKNIINYYGDTTIKGIEVNLNGTHQPINAAIALKAYELFEKIDVNNAFAAFKEAFIPGRFEMFNGFLLDGSHNPQAAEKFLENLNIYFKNDSKIALFGILDDKDKISVISKLIPEFEHVIVTCPPSHRAINCLETYNLVKDFSKSCEFIDDPLQAIEKLKEMKADLKVVTGSFYLVGFIRSYLENGYIDEELKLMRR
ncbi:bifunctional folylpolyglutamate synthase/dihydrofolate synthase [Thermosipho globiformans]|uniref:bifunctional folylpolyglutamate synthase/dihydrofolate synthase n=1 Tax=Thermosipho globiformans TaxID=380685 RepID=UPI000F8C9DC6|nr:folylpolyglutamate synthase/dihydrofolate synthase family protein [Thermosipho globiformans]